MKMESHDHALLLHSPLFPLRECSDILVRVRIDSPSTLQSELTYEPFVYNHRFLSILHPADFFDASLSATLR